jgi:hypothetical protein
MERSSKNIGNQRSAELVARNIIEALEAGSVRVVQ